MNNDVWVPTSHAVWKSDVYGQTIQHLYTKDGWVYEFAQAAFAQCKRWYILRRPTDRPNYNGWEWRHTLKTKPTPDYRPP